MRRLLFCSYSAKSFGYVQKLRKSAIFLNSVFRPEIGFSALKLATKCEIDRDTCQTGQKWDTTKLMKTEEEYGSMLHWS